jgi:hypothetical protein
MTDVELKAIEDRLTRGCPTVGVTLSPWAQQLQSDAWAMLRELHKQRAERNSRQAA